MKIRRSITISKDTERDVEKQANEESRSFSNMLERMAKKYLSGLTSK